ncbi:hypothetical protein AX14_000974 [Amanita brunnescens Koide BX004]|nr:hypothetical protein AX14_000974 [Amanita brunnescens Koide BX004]
MAAGNSHAKNWQDEVKRNQDIGRYSIGSLAAPVAPSHPQSHSNYDEQCWMLVKGSDKEEGRRSELQEFLDFVEDDATKDMDIVRWWQDHQKQFPTLASNALDVLAVPASSVPCKQLFSSAKLIAMDHHARLGPETFEQVQILKSAWNNEVLDLARYNACEVEEVDIWEWRGILDAKTEISSWNNDHLSIVHP